jgi:hypothetical protein
MHEYWRCGEASSAAGVATLSLLRSSYPDSPWTTAAVTTVYGSNGTLNEVARDKAPYEEAPVPEQSAYYAAPANEGIPSYATPIAAVPAYEGAPSYAPPVAAAPVFRPAPQPNVAAFDVSPPSDEAAQNDQAQQDDQAPQADAAPQQQEIAPEEAPTPPPAR